MLQKNSHSVIMLVLYIDNEHCLSLEQLKGYFSESLTPDSDIYADLLDYGRHGDIAVWLRDVVGEPELSSKVESIPSGLSDSAFYAELKGVITGNLNSDYAPLKPAFDKCFSIEDIRCEVTDKAANVSVCLKVKLCMNEEFELRVSCNWGTRGIMINPYSHPEGKTASFDFSLYKRPGKDIGEIMILADGKKLYHISKPGNEDVEITVGNVTFNMIHVEGGIFDMAKKKITLSNYLIGETPVTQALWQEVMRNNPSCFKGAQKPVESVNWHDCQNFIKKLNQRTGHTFRLPTEAEWEFAARGGIKSKGYYYSGSNKLNEVAWYYGNSNEETHPVKEKNPNELGIYDMSGNVDEWCQDWFSDFYERKSQTNPIGPSSGTKRVCRGGNYYDYYTVYCRPMVRCSDTPDSACFYRGFRLVLSE